MVATQCLRGDGPHQVREDKLKGKLGVVHSALRVSFLSTLADGTHVTCQAVSTAAQAVAFHLVQDLYAPLADVTLRRCQSSKTSALNPPSLPLSSNFSENEYSCLLSPSVPISSRDICRFEYSDGTHARRCGYGKQVLPQSRYDCPGEVHLLLSAVLFGDGVFDRARANAF